MTDILYKHKASIDKYLYSRVTDMFNINDKLVIFDISNTYFETGKHQSKIAKYGRSKEKRRFNEFKIEAKVRGRAKLNW